MALGNHTAKTQATFPFWVKRWRAYLGVTQKRFAELWGVSPSMVQKIEANDYEVGQLSFDRLESLRALLKMESAVFYGILSGDSGADEEGSLNITWLGADLTPADTLALPRSFMQTSSAHRAESLFALEVTPQTFATDRLRYALSPGSLVIVTKDSAPQPLDILVGTKTLHANVHLVIFKYPDYAEPLFLRPLDPGDERSLELRTAEVDLLGVYVGHWSSLGVS